MRLRDHDLFTRLLRTRPLLLGAIIYLCGCILGYALEVPAIVSLSMLAFALPSGIFLHYRHNRYAAAVLILALLPLGILRFDMDWKATEPFEDHPNATLSGRICEIPVWDPEAERTICVLEDLRIDDAPHKGRIRLYLRGDVAQLQAVQLGERITCAAHIWRADEATNPGQFNFSNYLRVNGLRGYATADIKSARFETSESAFGDRIRLFRISMSDRISRLFPRNTSLAQAFILGDKSGLSNEERESYSKSGAAHLLAISGMHVGVLAAFISALLGRFLHKRTAFLVTLSLLLLYGLLISYSASLLRAILMFAVLNSAPLAGRYSDAPTRLAAALLIYLLFRPVAILESSFVLSYGATAGIVFLYKPFQRTLHVEEFINKRTDVGFVSFLKRRLPQLILSSLLVTAAAQLVILPAIVHYFGAQPAWSFAVNLIAGPLAMIAYIISISAALLNLPPLAVIGDFLFGLLTQCVRFFSNLPPQSLRIARFPVWLTVLCALILFLSSDLSRLPKNLRSFLPLFVILAAFISNGISTLSTTGCSILFLDAGQADCAVVRAEGKIYLIDTGDSYSPAADYLSAMNYTPDGVFLSHPHTDHAGGLAEILEVCTPEYIYISPNWPNFEFDESISAALETALEKGSQIIYLSAGDHVQLSSKTLLQVLSPAAGFSTDSANDDSLILRIEYGDASAIFCGDAPSTLVGAYVSDIDILKVAHHGAADSLDPELLAGMSPSVAVIPVGYNNYGHPDGYILDLLAASGAQVFRTDINGAVYCKMNIDGSIGIRPYIASEDFHELE